MADICIIGAGLSGMITAKLLAFFGHQVTIIEAKSSPMLGPSGRHWFRLHTGLHHPENVTFAQSIQRTSIFGAPYFKGFYLKVPSPRYFVSKVNPIISSNGITPINKDEFIKVAENLKLHYATVLRYMPESEEIFGSPDKFFRIGELDETDPCCSKTASIMILSNERLIDLSVLSSAACADVMQNSNITLLLSHLVKGLRQQEDNKIVVEFKDSGCRDLIEQQFDEVINTTFWRTGDLFDIKMMKGLPETQFNFETGVKLYAVVKHQPIQGLTHLLQHGLNAPSYGRLGNTVGVQEIPEKAVLTQSRGKWFSQSSKIADSVELSPSEVEELADEAIEEVSESFTFLKDAEIVGGVTTTFAHETAYQEGFYRGLNIPDLENSNYHSIRARKIPNCVAAAHAVVLQIESKYSKVLKRLCDDRTSIGLASFMQEMMAFEDVRFKVPPPEQVLSSVIRPERNRSTIERFTAFELDTLEEVQARLDMLE